MPRSSFPHPRVVRDCTFTRPGSSQENEYSASTVLGCIRGCLSPKNHMLLINESVLFFLYFSLSTKLLKL